MVARAENSISVKYQEVKLQKRTTTIEKIENNRKLYRDLKH